MTVCLVSPAMVESTAAYVAAVRLLSSSFRYALTVSSLPTVSPNVVDPSGDPLACPLMLLGTLAVTLYGSFLR